jgi:ABC-type lipoprotein release transport system permease subunit
MSILSASLLIIGLVFNIILLLLVLVSVLLIYSLLMTQVQQKTHENGLMRLMGLSNSGYVASLMISSTCFVLPSILVGYILSYPALYVFQLMTYPDGAARVTPPSAGATL